MQPELNRPQFPDLRTTFKLFDDSYLMKYVTDYELKPKESLKHSKQLCKPLMSQKL